MFQFYNEIILMTSVLDITYSVCLCVCVCLSVCLCLCVSVCLYVFWKCGLRNCTVSSLNMTGYDNAGT